MNELLERKILESNFRIYPLNFKLEFSESFTNSRVKLTF